MVAIWTLAVICAGLLSVVNGSGVFYLKLDEFENYHGMRSDHRNCDNGRPCDPKFHIKVKGSWGEDSKISDCMVDKNHILFENTIGTALTNPLSYKMDLYTFPIVIDIRVKDCLFGETGDDIADFYKDLSGLPTPFLFNEPVDSQFESDRIRKLELSSLPPAPMSIKMRVSIWHRCDRYFYGPHCHNFCHAELPGWSCNASGVLVCSSPACPGEATTGSTTTRATTASTRVHEMTTTTPSTAASKSPDASTAAVRTKSSVSSTKSDTTSSFDASTNIKGNSGGRAQATDGEQSVLPALNTPLHLLLLIILALLLIVGITATAVLCSRRRRATRPILVSNVRYNRDGIGLDLPLGTADRPHSQYRTNPVYITERQHMQYRQTETPQPCRPDSGVYEEPIDLSDRNLPPLPARDIPVAATFSKRK